MDFLSDFSATACFWIMKFCVHLQLGNVYCVNEKYDAYPHLVFFFEKIIFSFCHSFITHMEIFRQFSQQLLALGLLHFVDTFR